MCPRLRILAALLLLAAGSAGAARAKPPITDEPMTIVAAFGRRSYAPDRTAWLVLQDSRPWLTVQLFRAGLGPRTNRNDVMTGVAVTPPRHVRGTARLAFRLGDWPSGLYFARMTAPGGFAGYAPVVLRPRRLGATRVAVVLPTNTWEAYNFRDSDNDGVGDTWYADAHIRYVDLTRPYLNRGVPPHYRGYDAGFLRWFAREKRRADFLSDDDLERIPGAQLARLYDVVVFPGHEEYVTRHVYDAITQYRNLGGNLAFLSANNFFYRVVRRGDRLYRTGRWRDAGRWGASLIGDEYVGWFENRFPNRPYTVVDTSVAPWLFRGTGLHDGDRFGNYGIEVDQRSARSPRGTRVLARIRDIFGRGRSAEMTYYTTRAGAKVFAAGVMNFGGSAGRAPMSKLLDNLWAELSRP